jgi:hypothetical protein
MKLRKLISFLAVAVSALTVLSGCKPKPISGQLFIVTESRLNIPLGAVEIDVISASDADAFLTQKEKEIEKESSALNIQLKSLNIQLDESNKNKEIARKKFLETQRAYDDYMNNQQYTNNQEYIALLNKENSALAQGRRVNAGAAGSFNSPTPRAGQFYDQANAVSLMRLNLQRLGYKLGEPLRTASYQASVASNQASSECSSLLSKLQSLQLQLQSLRTPEMYFGNFSPAVIEKTVTDSEGNFTMQTRKRSAKIFAKAQRQTLDSTENYFWLIDSPVKGEKLILSNNNMFSVPKYE